MDRTAGGATAARAFSSKGAATIRSVLTSCNAYAHFVTISPDDRLLLCCARRARAHFTYRQCLPKGCRCIPAIQYGNQHGLIHIPLMALVKGRRTLRAKASRIACLRVGVVPPTPYCPHTSFKGRTYEMSPFIIVRVMRILLVDEQLSSCIVEASLYDRDHAAFDRRMAHRWCCASDGVASSAQIPEIIGECAKASVRSKEQTDSIAHLTWL